MPDVQIRDIPVIGGDGSLYVGSGDRLVLLCESGDVPRWRNSVALTSDAARTLGHALIAMADQSEMPMYDDPTPHPRPSKDRHEGGGERGE